MLWKLETRRSAVCGARDATQFAALDGRACRPEQGGQTVLHDGSGLQRAFQCADPSTPQMLNRWPAPMRRDRSSLSGCRPTWTWTASGGLPERCCSGDGAGTMRPFATGSHPQRPCICRESWRGNGGSLRRLGLVRRNRPARQISPTCGLPREANFSGLPVLHCVAAPSLRYGMRRARTLTHRITPRPRWARPG